jgi:hypothetical protein
LALNVREMEGENACRDEQQKAESNHRDTIAGPF